MNKLRTIGEVYQQASSFLDNAFEAELMLRKILHYDRVSFYLNLQKPFPPRLIEKWNDWLRKRKSNQPIQYIMREQEFYGRVFEVDASVLIPRPETEILIEKVLDRIDHSLVHQPLNVVDLGTGSGAIAVTLAAERSNLRTVAIDYSQKALQIAQKNAHRHGVSDRIVFLQGDFLAPLQDKQRAIDIVVSNPPYIPSNQINQLERQVRDFEPVLALDGGYDGLAAYRKIIWQLRSWKLLSKKYLLAFEIGYVQKKDVVALLHSSFPSATVDSYQDLAGLDRVVVAQVV